MVAAYVATALILLAYACSLYRRQRRVRPLFEDQRLLVGGQRLFHAERALVRLTQQHPGRGAGGETPRRGLRCAHRAEPVFPGAPQLDEGGERRAECGRPGAGEPQPEVGPWRGAGPSGAAQREADEGVADHCLIMVLRPMRLQSGMARESRSLAGRRIVVTRAREQAGDLVRALQELGAEVITAPTIRIEAVAGLAPLGAPLADHFRAQLLQRARSEEHTSELQSPLQLRCR